MMTDLAEQHRARPAIAWPMSLADELGLGDELYEQIQRFLKGAKFRLHGQFVRYHTRERARKRLRAERGRDFIPCGHGYKVVEWVEQATGASHEPTERRRWTDT